MSQKGCFRSLQHCICTLGFNTQTMMERTYIQVVDVSMDAPPFNALWWGRVHLEKLVALVSQLHRPLLVCPQLVDYLGDQDGGFKASSSILGA